MEAGLDTGPVYLRARDGHRSRARRRASCTIASRRSAPRRSIAALPGIADGIAAGGTPGRAHWRPMRQRIDKGEARLDWTQPGRGSWRAACARSTRGPCARARFGGERPAHLGGARRCRRAARRRGAGHRARGSGRRRASTSRRATAVLRLLRVQRPGGRAVSAGDFANRQRARRRRARAEHAPRARDEARASRCACAPARVVARRRGRGVSLARALPYACAGLARSARRRAAQGARVRHAARVPAARTPRCSSVSIARSRATGRARVRCSARAASALGHARRAARGRRRDGRRRARRCAATPPPGSSMRCCVAISASAPRSKPRPTPTKRRATLHPRWLLERLREDWPQDWNAIVDAGQRRAADVAARQSAARRRATTTRGASGRSRHRRAAVAHAPAALRLTPRLRRRMRCPASTTGLVSVQDAAAQLAAPLLDLAPGARVLDACAAPGGKTAHILEYCPRRACHGDRHRRRAPRTGAHDLARLGLARAARVRRTPATPAGLVGRRGLRPHPARRAVHGDGRDPAPSGHQAPAPRGRRRARSRASRRACSMRCGRCSRPGGRLLYATCSLLRREGAVQVERFLERNARRRAACRSTAAWGRAIGPGRQVLPGEDAMDGFYYSCLGEGSRGHSE